MIINTLGSLINVFLQHKEKRVIMSIRIQWFLFILFIGMTTFVMSINASDRKDLVENGTVSLELVPFRGIYVSIGNVYQDGGGVVITGTVRCHYGSFAIAGHVDITILDPAGKTLKKVTVSHVPKTVLRKEKRDVFFTGRLPIIPPRGSTVRVSYHNSLDKTSNCK